MKPNHTWMKPRIYLSGMDWVIRGLDRITRAVSGSGNYSQLVLVLRGRLDGDVFRHRVTDFIRSHPVLSGYCRRHMLNLAPYWSLPESAPPVDALSVEVRDCPGREPVQDVLRQLGEIDGGARLAHAKTAFLALRYDDYSYVSMWFDHQVLDARGAELVMMQMADNGGSTAPRLPAARPAHLDHWMDKFRSGQVINRQILAMKERPTAMLPWNSVSKQAESNVRFVFRAFTPSETADIKKRADRQAGYLLLLPYLLGASVHGLHRVFSQRGVAGGDYIIPVSMDTRTPAASENEIFFNHLSFNFYRFSAAVAADCRSLWEQAVLQMVDQTQRQTAQHLEQACYLMRILPASWLGRLLSLPLGGSLGTMSWALVGKNGYTSDTFMGVPVTHVFHLPRVPVPPGIGMFFTQYRDRLTLVLSYWDGVLHQRSALAWVDRVSEIITGAA